MKTIFKITFLSLGLLLFVNASAQESTKKADTKQAPAKQEDKKSKPKSDTKAAPAAGNSKTDDSGTGTQKMAITEQGVDRTKKKQKSATTTTPAPAPKDK